MQSRCQEERGEPFTPPFPQPNTSTSQSLSSRFLSPIYLLVPSYLFEDKSKNNKPGMQGESSSSKAEPSGATEPSSGALYTAIVSPSILVDDRLSDCFYVDPGASDHALVVTTRDETSSKEPFLSYRWRTHPRRKVRTPGVCGTRSYTS